MTPRDESMRGRFEALLGRDSGNPLDDRERAELESILERQHELRDLRDRVVALDARLRRLGTAGTGIDPDQATEAWALFRRVMLPRIAPVLGAAPEIVGHLKPAHAEDAVLAQAAASGDEQAQRTLYHQLVGVVESAIRSRGLMRVREDLSQEIFARAFRNLSRYRGDSSLSTWIYRIALNLLSNYYHRVEQREEREVSDASLPVDADDEGSFLARMADERDEHEALERRETADTVHGALAALPEPQRTVIELHFLSGLTCDAIAGIVGVPLGTVQSRLARGRLRLATMLSRDELERS